MVYFWLVLLVLLNCCWLGLVFFALPGNWLMVASVGLFAWWRWEEGIFSIHVLVAITVLALIGEIIEFLGGAGGAKKAGAGWRGALGAIGGAIMGAILGTFLIPVVFVGTVVGAGIGAGLGAWGLEFAGGQKMRKSIRTGVGAGLGTVVGTLAKFLVGVVIWTIAAVAAFWP